jgi:hypothetical protein
MGVGRGAALSTVGRASAVVAALIGAVFVAPDCWAAGPEPDPAPIVQPKPATVVKSGGTSPSSTRPAASSTPRPRSSALSGATQRTRALPSTSSQSGSSSGSPSGGRTAAASKAKSKAIASHKLKLKEKSATRKRSRIAPTAKVARSAGAPGIGGPELAGATVVHATAGPESGTGLPTIFLVMFLFSGALVLLAALPNDVTYRLPAPLGRAIGASRLVIVACALSLTVGAGIALLTGAS